jgi:hypothetical protein
MALPQGEKLLAASAAIGILHHIDHVLRADHSGWPFRADVTPFTFSLLVYPVFFSVFLIRKPLYQAAASFALFLFATLAHTFLETPFDQYHTWAHGSGTPGYEGLTNLLHIRSQAMGLLAVTLTVLLSSLSLAATVAFLLQAGPARGRA